MSAREIADRVGPEVAAPRPYEAHLVAQAGGDAAKEIFELQKMQLLVAILREGRERLAARLSRACAGSDSSPRREKAFATLSRGV
jgi:hypothetical protein